MITYTERNTHFLRERYPLRTRPTSCPLYSFLIFSTSRNDLSKATSKKTK